VGGTYFGKVAVPLARSAKEFAMGSTQQHAHPECRADGHHTGAFLEGAWLAEQLGGGAAHVQDLYGGMREIAKSVWPLFKTAVNCNELNQKRQETENLREELKMTKRELACYQNTTQHNAHDQAECRK
jgi:hypothetical protein